MAKETAKGKGIVLQAGIQWIAKMDSTHENSLELRHSPAVCLLAHLCNKTPVVIAEEVIKFRKIG